MVLTGRRTGMFHRDDVTEVARRYLAECLAVARAEGADMVFRFNEASTGSIAASAEDYRVVPTATDKREASA
jgi:2-dehydropantoate 2-reductase